jgi:hypothetical protein
MSSAPQPHPEPPTPGPHDSPLVDLEPWSPCVETSRVVSDSFKTPWGATPRDVLNIALGTHRTTLTWQRESSFSYGVEGTSTTLVVEITRRGPATFFDRDGSLRPPPGGGPFLAYHCPPELLIPVRIKAETQDGVIAVEADSVLQTSSRRYIGLFVEQPLAGHRGTLRIRDIREKGLLVPDFGIFLGFSRKRTMVGAIRGSYLVENSGGLYVEYACFPDTPPRELRGLEEFIGCNG